MKILAALIGLALLIGLIRLWSALFRRGGPSPAGRRRRSARRGRGQSRTAAKAALSLESAPAASAKRAVLPPSPQFAATAALLHLAALVCAADDAISPAERTLLEQHIDRAPGVSAPERAQLHAQLATLLGSKPNFRGVKKRLEALDAGQRALVADLLIGVAGTDGQVEPDEIRLLARIYPMLGLSADDVYSRIHALAAGAPAAAAAPAAAGNAGSVTGTATATGAPAPIRLNMSAVQTKLAQSAEVSALLGDIFSEEEPDTAAPAPASVATGATGPAPASVTPPAPPGTMSSAHGMLLARLATRAAWSRAEFEAMAKELQVLPDGAIDALNEAAFERAGGPVLEGDDPLHVDLATAKDLLA